MDVQGILWAKLRKYSLGSEQYLFCVLYHLAQVIRLKLLFYYVLFGPVSRLHFQTIKLKTSSKSEEFIIQTFQTFQQMSSSSVAVKSSFY